MDVADLWNELESLLIPIFGDFRARLFELSVEQKHDTTLLTQADLDIERQIVAQIEAVDPGAAIVAEEGTRGRGLSVNPGRVWVIDPIDGTAEFVDEGRREFCSVVCLLEELRPVAAFVLAPELGPGRTAVSVRVNGPGCPIEVNGQLVSRSVESPNWASLTRSSTVPARTFEPLIEEFGLAIKVRTTSQTLDMARTCVDLTAYTDLSLPPFAVFYREKQKVWDGAAGMCLAYAAGLRVTDRRGRDRETVDVPLEVAEPCFESTLVGETTLVDRVLATMSSAGTAEPSVND
jgi:3'(2'), 5'-bisphosphate nucleotidase